MANVIGVSALNRYVKTLLERDPVLADVALRGEISNFTHHFKTGHYYFSLKDEKCAVKAVMFRSDAQRVPFVPENGMRVIVRCRVSLFERDGAFQVYVQDMFPDGVGAMQLAFDQLKARLEKEGLFDAARKKMLPQTPRCVGLVTSKTGAALQDILQVTARRCPMAHLLLCPVNVQGRQAAADIVRAIRTLDESGRADVIIVARGGGSREDLWVFNDEAIARCVYACRTPVVSAIGHEIDFTILDFAADVRAPTPSAAAELVMPDMAARLWQARRTFASIGRLARERCARCEERLGALRASPALENARRRPHRLAENLALQACRARELSARRMQDAQARLAHAAQLAESLNPYGVLARGYGIVYSEGRAVKSAQGLRRGDALRVLLASQTLECTFERAREGGAAGSFTEETADR